MIKFDFRIDDVEHEKAKQELVEKAKQVLYLSVKKFQQLAAQRAPEGASGNLAQSIGTGMTPAVPGASHYVVTDGTNYGIYVEEGTRPHMPPVEPLKKWARRVLGDEDAAWAVAMKIKREGTKPQKFWALSYREVTDKWIDRYTEQVFSR